MNFNLPWEGHPPAGPATWRLACFQEVLIAASNTRFYRPWLERAHLADTCAIRRLGSPEDALVLLPRFDLSDVLEDFDALRNPDGKPAELRVFVYPLGEPPRTAILSPGFRESRRVRVFENGWRRQLPRFKPEAIAGPPGALRALALAVREGKIGLPPLTHAVIAFTGIEHGLIRGSDRNLFWEVFQVPLFEQFRGLGGELLAAECEAHHGLHVRSDETLVELEGIATEPEILYTSLVSLRYPLLRLATGFASNVHAVACGCGSAVPRLTALRRLWREERVQAAHAGD